MYVFSSLQAAQSAGFRWYAFSEAEGLHIVELDQRRSSGKRMKALAFARPSPDEAERPPTPAFQYA